MIDYPGWNGLAAPTRVELTTTARLVVTANPNRIALLLSGVPTVITGFSFNPDVGALGPGILIGAGGGTILLSRMEHGGMVTRAVWGVLSVGTVTIEVWESFL